MNQISKTRARVFAADESLRSWKFNNLCIPWDSTLFLFYCSARLESTKYLPGGFYF